MSLLLQQPTQSISVDVGPVADIIFNSKRYVTSNEDGTPTAYVYNDDAVVTDADGNIITVGGDTVMLSAEPIVTATDVTTTASNFTVTGTQDPIENMTVNAVVIDFTAYVDSLSDVEGDTGYTLSLAGFDTEGEAFGLYPNVAPVADAGTPATVSAGTRVRLDARGSNDSDGTIVAWAWAKVSGPDATFEDATLEQPYVRVTAPGAYVFEVTVTDDGGATSTAQVTVTAVAIKQHPQGDWTSGGINFNANAGNVPNEANPTISLPYVDGELVRVEWADIEPTGGSYDFAIIDAKIAQAESFGKRISLGVIDALHAPQWLKDEAGTFEYDFRGTPVTTPLIGSTQYVVRKRNLLNALAGRYDSNDTVAAVYFTHAAMSNGIEGHWRVDQTAWQTIYPGALHLQWIKNAFDSHKNAFIKTPILIEGHTIFGDAQIFSDLYDYAFEQIGVRAGVAAWWLASRMWTDNTSSEYPTKAVFDRAVANGSPFVGQYIGNMTADPWRFDGSDPNESTSTMTTTQAATQEQAYWEGTVDAYEIWNEDLANQEVVAILTGYLFSDTLVRALEVVKCEIVHDENLQIFEGYGNREKIGFTVDDPTGLPLKNGMIDWSDPRWDRVEVIGGSDSKISTSDIPGSIDNEWLRIRLGDLKLTNTATLDLTFVAYIVNEEFGFVLTANHQIPLAKASVFRKRFQS